MKVYVKYSFIFDPKESWMHLSDFENDLSSYFRGMGFEAEVIQDAKTVSDEILVYLHKVEVFPLAPESPEKTPLKSTKQMFSKLAPKRGYDGKFKKENGS